MSAYLFNGMDEWYENNRHKLGAAHTKRRASVPCKETKKEQAWVKKLHYGSEYDSGRKEVTAHHIGGHTQKIFDDGNITCDCLGWIMKRSGIKRECCHCRELYGKLKGISTPPKSKPKSFDVSRKELLNTVKEVLRGLQ